MYIYGKISRDISPYTMSCALAKCDSETSFPSENPVINQGLNLVQFSIDGKEQ